MKLLNKSKLLDEDESLKDYLYKVITFVGSEDDEGKKDIDIVLSSWIRFSEEENKYFTRFPSPPYDSWTMKELNKLLKNCAPAPSIWMEYEIKIEHEAKTFSEAHKIFEILTSEPKTKKKHSKKSSSKTKKANNNKNESFKIQDFNETMNESFLPYVLVKKLDDDASPSATSKFNSSTANNSLVDKSPTTPKNSKKVRSKTVEFTDNNSNLKELDASNLVLSEKRNLRKRKTDAQLENNSPSKRSVKSSKNKKAVSFASPMTDFNDNNENSENNLKITANETVSQEQEVETNPVNNLQEQEIETQIIFNNSLVQEVEVNPDLQDQEVELPNTDEIYSNQQSELSADNSIEKQNTTRIDDNDNAAIDVFSHVITKKEKDDPCLLFPRIIKALHVIHLNQLDAQRTLRDITLNLTNNEDLPQTFFDKFNLILPITTMDEFILIDDALKSNPSFKDNFTLMIKNFMDSDSVLSQCLEKILKACITEEVRAQFNASTITENSPKIFKDTEFYKILLDFITNEFQKRQIQVTEDDFLNQLEIFFENSSD